MSAKVHKALAGGSLGIWAILDRLSYAVVVDVLNDVMLWLVHL